MNKQETIKQIKELIEEKERLLEGDELDELYEYDIEVLKNALQIIEKTTHKRPINGVWVATMDSEHYEWRAAGRTEDEAINAIVKEWNKGANRTKMTREELEDYYCIWCEFIKYGECDYE